MVTHIVMWKYRDDVPEETREDHRQKLRALSDIVPGIESLSVGSDFLRSSRSYDTGLSALFRDRSVLEAYTVHPDHVKVVELGHTITETMAKVDFEN